MPQGIRKVNVVGHQHPDTDSICAAISYAYLKSQVDPDTEYEARRAGAINRETAFVLQHFGFKEPRLITDASPQIKDTNYNKTPAIGGETSLYRAWNLMRDDRTSTLCIAGEDGGLQGLITVKDIANANMDILDSEVIARSDTRFSNIVDTLEGELVVGDPDGAVTKGHVIVGTSPEMMEDVLVKGDVVLTTNRYETQDYAVRAGASPDAPSSPPSSTPTLHRVWSPWPSLYARRCSAPMSSTASRSTPPLKMLRRSSPAPAIASSRSSTRTAAIPASSPRPT